MKQGAIVTRLVMLALFCAIAIYLGVYAWRMWNDPFQTVLTYRYSMDDAGEARGIFVREETVYAGQGLIVDLIPAEGEKVGMNQTVAVLYRDATALDRKQTIHALELELSQLYYARGRRNAPAGDAAALDSQIITELARLHSSVSAGNLSPVENRALNLRSLVLRRVDNPTGDTGSAAAIETMIDSVTAQLGSLSAAAELESVAVTADKPGIFSGQVDGYEALLTPVDLSSLTAAQLDGLLSRKVPPDEGAAGKLITDSRWYFAALVHDEDAKRLLAGNQARLVFSGDFSGEVSMRIERIGDNEDGLRCVVFSSTRYLSDTTLLRKQTADIVFARYTGVRVPKRAVRVLEDGSTGVFAISGAQAVFKRVNIVREGEDFYLVEGTGEGRRLLHAGDEVIISAVDLYDGKVVR